MAPILKLQARIRDAVVLACEQTGTTDLTQIVKEEEGDTIYAIDRVSEDLLISLLSREIAPTVPVILIAEGLPDGQVVLPKGTAAADARLRIIVDPIDGTRGLMYQKRSAWILTGVALNNGPETSLARYSFGGSNRSPAGKTTSV